MFDNMDITEQNFFEHLSFDLFRVCMRFVHNEKDCDKIIDEVISKYSNVVNKFKENKKISVILDRLLKDLEVLKSLDEDLIKNLIDIEVFLAEKLREKFSCQILNCSQPNVDDKIMNDLENVKKWWLV